MHYRYILNILLMFISLFTMSFSEEIVNGDGKYFSLRIGKGYSDLNSLAQILMSDYDRYEGHTSVINLDGGWRFIENMQDLPLDWYLKGGVSYFDENGLQDNFYEATLYVKVYYKYDFMDNRIRLGLGEGLSWASSVPIIEIAEAKMENDEVAQFLNYLDISVDFDLGRLIGVEALNDLYIGYTIKHRSGVAGLFSGVSGGSNYKMLTIEKNF